MSTAFSPAYATGFGNTGLCGSWYTVGEAREYWRDAPYEDDDVQQLLDVAQFHVLEYGPDRVAADIAATGCVPVNYRLAQIMQARNLWNASKTDPAGTIGDGSFEIRPFPLDWTIKQIIRPKSAKPVVI